MSEIGGGSEVGEVSNEEETNEATRAVPLPLTLTRPLA